MSKTCRDWRLDQRRLLPPSVQDLVPEDHLARFVVALVRDELELSAIYAGYAGEKGQPPCHPAMMTALLPYGCAVGVYSSRRLARACRERVDFMALVALDAPDFRTISGFRRRHLAALRDLFVQVLKLCEQAGLVIARSGWGAGPQPRSDRAIGHVALDGTKVRANASKHKAMSYARMVERERELAAEVARWLETAEAADVEEDRQFGADKRGDELPAWVADKQQRLSKIRAAKAALEAEAEAAAQDKGRRRRYRLKKQIVEPVFGQIKAARGFRQFLLRGIDKVRAAWAMICTAHNLLKLARAAA